MAFYLSGDPEADELLASNPFALLTGMVLDQQIPLEKAFSSPYVLAKRIGGKLDAKRIASLEPDEVIAVFTEKPALHRFPAAMAERVQAVAQIVMNEYGGDAAAIWQGAESGDELLKRLRALPGFGEQKARIFLALLAKRFGVKPQGWEKAAEPFGAKGSHVSVADIDSPSALLAVREHKKQMKAAAKSVATLSVPKARKATKS